MIVYIVYDTTDAGTCEDCRRTRIAGVYSDPDAAEAQAADWNGWAVAAWEVDGGDVTAGQMPMDENTPQGR